MRILAGSKGRPTLGSPAVQYLLVFCFALLVGVSAFVISSLQTKVYEAQVKIAYGPVVDYGNPLVVSPVDAKVLQAQLEGVGNAMQRAAQRRIADGVAARSNPSQIDYTVTAKVENAANGSYAVVTAASSDPRVALAAVGAYVGTFLDWRRVVELAQMTDQLKVLRLHMSGFKSRVAKESTVYLDLDQRYQDLEIRIKDNKAGKGTFRVAATATLPQKPVAPQPARTGLVGFGIALLLGAGAVFIVGQVKGSTAETEDVSRALGLPFLGRYVLPSIDASAATTGVLPGADAAPRHHPESHSLMSNVDFAVADRSVSSVALVGTSHTETRGLLACDLATWMAAKGMRVTIVDGDLARPSLHRLLDVPNERGLAALVSGGALVDEVLQCVPERSLESRGGPSPGQAGGSVAVVKGEKGEDCLASADACVLRVVVAGPSDITSSVVMSSRRCGVALRELAELADVLLVAAPSVWSAEAAVVCAAVDCVVLVAEPSGVRQSVLPALAARLRELECEVLGVAVVEEPRRAAHWLKPWGRASGVSSS